MKREILLIVPLAFVMLVSGCIGIPGQVVKVSGASCVQEPAIGTEPCQRIPEQYNVFSSSVGSYQELCLSERWSVGTPLVGATSVIGTETGTIAGYCAYGPDHDNQGYYIRDQDGNRHAACYNYYDIENHVQCVTPQPVPPENGDAGPGGIPGGNPPITDEDGDTGDDASSGPTAPASDIYIPIFSDLIDVIVRFLEMIL
jgi:hypothetical protein